jgi:hypothetical protein
MYVRTKNELFRLSSGKAVVFCFRLDDTTRHSEMFESSAGPGWPGNFSVLCDKNINNTRKARAVRYLTLDMCPSSFFTSEGRAVGRANRAAGLTERWSPGNWSAEAIEITVVFRRWALEIFASPRFQFPPYGRISSPQQLCGMISEGETIERNQRLGHSDKLVIE